MAAITTYLSAFNVLAAKRVARRILALADSLETSPLRGRPLGETRRELTQVSPYLIRYRVEDETVVILEVRHGAREPNTS